MGFEGKRERVRGGCRELSIFLKKNEGFLLFVVAER